MGRSPCCEDIRELKKGPWTQEEDEKLISYIKKNGHGSWRGLPKKAGLNRCGKSCRLRWTNYLRPDIKRGRFSEEEEDMIIKLHSVLGNKWSRIATHLPGRTDNEIKNYWNTYLRKKLLQMGIDPVTHKPRTDLNLLANLTQILLTPPNLGSFISSWDINNPLMLQPSVATEVAKLQVLQNIVQILNTSNNSSSSFSNINQNIPLNLGLFSNLNGLGSINGHDTNDAMRSNSQGFCQFPNFVSSSNQKMVDKYDINSQEFYRSLDNISNSKKSLSSNTTTTTTCETLDESRLPSLITFSPENLTVNQIESNTNSTNGSPEFTPTNDDFFDGWEKLLDDGSSDVWKEFIN